MSACFAVVMVPGVAGALELGVPDVWDSKVPVVLDNGVEVDANLSMVLIRGEAWDGGKVEAKITSSGGDDVLIESVATFEEETANFANNVKVEDGKVTALATWEAPEAPGKLIRKLVVRPAEGADIVIEPMGAVQDVPPIRLGQPPYPVVRWAVV